jgi:hypothetical protein
MYSWHSIYRHTIGIQQDSSHTHATLSLTSNTVDEGQAITRTFETEWLHGHILDERSMDKDRMQACSMAQIGLVDWIGLILIYMKGVMHRTRAYAGHEVNAIATNRTVKDKGRIEAPRTP